MNKPRTHEHTRHVSSQSFSATTAPQKLVPAALVVGPDRGLFCAHGAFRWFIATIFIALETSSRKSDYYVQALAKARSNPRVIERFGQPLEPGWFGSSNVQINGPTGSADLEIPITGPKAKGTIYVVAKKSAGKWRLETLEVEAEGEQERINLLPTPAPAP